MLSPAIFARLRRLPLERTFEQAVLVAVVLAGAVAISPNVADPDLWGHVRYGSDVLRQGLPTTTTYSYVAQNQPWVNHENVMEVLLALGAATGGPLGLVAMKLLAGMGLLLTVLHVCRKQGAGLLASTAILLLTASGVAHYWSLRPQLFSFVAYTAMLWLLGWCFEGWAGRWQLRLPNRLARLLPNRWTGKQTAEVSYHHRRLRWLWLMPVLMAAWTNAHGGFLAGGCIFAAYLAMRGAEAWSQGGARAIGLIKRFALMIAATGAATFLNPYGPHFHVWLFDDLRVPRPEITEWLPPNLTDPQSLPLLLLAAVFIATLAFSRRSFDITHLLILAATLWQSLEHQRHIPFFALSVAFFLPHHVEDVLARLTQSSRQAPRDESCSSIAASTCVNACLTRSVRATIKPTLIAASLLIAYLVVGVKLFDRLSDLKVHRAHYPVSAVQFLADQKLHGRIVCTFNWAQYVLDTFRPSSANGDPRGLLVQIDGRCRTAYSQAMLDEHFDFLFGEQPPSERYRDPHSAFDPLKVLDQGNPNLVLLDRGQPHSEQVMHSQSQHWVLLYQDQLAQLWGRRERYDDPHSPDYLPPQRRVVTNQPQTGHATWPAYPVASHN
jgi:hypothetical protein